MRQVLEEVRHLQQASTRSAPKSTGGFLRRLFSFGGPSLPGSRPLAALVESIDDCAAEIDSLPHSDLAAAPYQGTARSASRALSERVSSEYSSRPSDEADSWTGRSRLSSFNDPTVPADAVVRVLEQRGGLRIKVEEMLPSDAIVSPYHPARAKLGPLAEGFIANPERPRQPRTPRALVVS